MAWEPSAEQAANLGMGNNPFLGQANPYLQQNIDAASGDLVRNYNLTTQPAFNAAMAKSGSFGNEGVAQMNADAQNTLQKNLGNLSNNMRMQDYNNQQGMYQWQQGLLNQQNQWGKQFDEQSRQWNLGFDRNVYNDAYGQNMQNLQMGMGLLGSMAGYNQQDLVNANAQQNTPLEYWKQFSQGANSLGQGYGTTTGQVGSTSNPLASAMGGAQLGGALNNYGKQQGWWGANSGTPISQSPYSNWGTGGDTYTTGGNYNYDQQVVTP
jgi:hypothetical protein